MEMTFAKIAQRLAKKETKYTDKLNGASSVAERNTARRMLDRVNNLKQELENENRMVAEPQQEQVPQFGDGGFLGFLETMGRILRNNTAPMANISKSGQRRMVRAPYLDITIPEPKMDARRILPKDPTFDYQYFQTPETTAKVATDQTAAALKKENYPEKVVAPDVMLDMPSITSDEALHDLVAKYQPLERDRPGLQTGKLAGFQASQISKAKNMQGNSGFMDKLDGAMPGVMRTAGILGTFMDNFANRRAINRMQGPLAPVYSPGVALDTNYNINPQLTEAREAETSFNRGIDASNTSTATANANKIGAFSQRLRSTGQLYGQKANVESQMRNQQTMINAQINERNTALGNAYNQSKTDFNNMKTQAIAANTANFGQDLMDIASDYQQNVVSPAQRLKIWKDYLNRFGVGDRKELAYMNPENFFKQ